MNIIRNWRRFMACGCSHGTYADPVAIDTVIHARDRWLTGEHDRMFHLGDAFDMHEHMAAGKGEGSLDALLADMSHGIGHLEGMRVTDYLPGNHEARLWRNINSTNANVAMSAFHAIQRIEKAVADLRCSFVKYEGIYSIVKLGDMGLTHGTIYNETACRDMAEMYCLNGIHKVGFVHTHRVGIAMGRRDDNPVGYNLGTLTRRGCMDYSNTRRASFAWTQAFMYGEFCDDQTVAWLCIRPDHATDWRLPF